MKYYCKKFKLEMVNKYKKGENIYARSRKYVVSQNVGAD